MGWEEGWVEYRRGSAGNTFKPLAKYGTRRKAAPHKLTNATQSLRYSVMDRQLEVFLRLVVVLMPRRNQRGEAAAGELREGLFCFHLPGGFAISAPWLRRGDRVVYRT